MYNGALYIMRVRALRRYEPEDMLPLAPGLPPEEGTPLIGPVADAEEEQGFGEPTSKGPTPEDWPSRSLQSELCYIVLYYIIMVHHLMVRYI